MTIFEKIVVTNLICYVCTLLYFKFIAKSTTIKMSTAVFIGIWIIITFVITAIATINLILR